MRLQLRRVRGLHVLEVRHVSFHLTHHFRDALRPPEAPPTVHLPRERPHGIDVPISEYRYINLGGACPRIPPSATTTRGGDGPRPGSHATRRRIRGRGSAGPYDRSRPTSSGSAAPPR